MEEKKRILIVDDLPTNIKVLADHLMEAGEYIINITNDGYSALDLVEKVSPDLILLDVMMPGIDGFETCRRLKEMESNSDIPVIFLTARHEISDIVNGFEVGGSDYITKPFNSVELLSRIKTHLELKEKRDLLEEKMDALASTQEMLRRKVQQMESEMERAHIIQEMFLPKSAPENVHYKTAFRYIPMEKVGGDYINFPIPSEDGIGFFIGDLTGHGVSAALYMALIKFVSDQLLPNCAFCPNELLVQMNDQLQNQMQASFLTAIYGYVEHVPEDNSFNCKLAAAAHPLPILCRKESDAVELIELPNTGAIGILPELSSENVIIKLQSGDRLYLYTDGILETLNVEDQQFGKEKLLEAIIEGSQLTIEQSLDIITSKVDAFRNGYEVTDDVTLVCVEVK
ncbi:MAG: SpoIIE family protein phosphatase [Lentisphaerales bacterium]|nr:SpoIIE family protein phosphatase [Lentisphaerales bacterium]